jgi:RND family efflux transporter MFP subunit
MQKTTKKVKKFKDTRMKIFGKKIKKRYIIGLSIIILIVLIRLGGGSNFGTEFEFVKVETRDISENVVLAGNIDVDDRVDLGFGISGRVSAVSYEEGQEVKKGDTVARLSMASLQADLIEARANLDVVRANADATGIDLSGSLSALENTVSQQTTLVDSAYRTLLNTDLQAYPDDSSTSATAPIITGTYNGSSEGGIIIDVYGSSSNSGFSFRLDGLSAGTYTAYTDAPGPLGGTGLYIQFTDNVSYGNTDWTVPIPNTRSTNYTAAKNSYDQALNTQVFSVNSAQDDYSRILTQETSSDRTTKTEAEIAQAQARINAISAQMQDGVIKAPFDGVIGRLNLEVGEVVTANNSYVTLLGQTEFELVMEVPEIDVSKLSLGSEVDVVLDAYGEGEIWQGEVIHIDVLDTIVDGVPVYKTRVRILDIDERVRVGMNARASIVTQEKNAVLSIPRYFIERDVEGSYVYVGNEEQKERRDIELGIESSDGFVEVVSGLSNGEQLVRETNKFAPSE